MAASLLTRIAHAADPHSSERQSYRDHDVESAIMTHLAQMLNTRQGSSLTCPDYGIAEISEVIHDFPDAIGIMQRAIKNSILSYEPRLKNVQVRHLKNEALHSMILEFEITAQLQLADGRKQAIRFGTSMDNNGNVKLT
jgi:type VI secretion system protein